jgi:hypothetical protein
MNSKIDAYAPEAIIEDALNHAPASCRYHGTNWGFLGWEPDSRPRCDSCKHPYAAGQARLRLAEMVDDRDEARRTALHFDQIREQVFALLPDLEVEFGIACRAKVRAALDLPAAVTPPSEGTQE